MKKPIKAAPPRAYVDSAAVTGWHARGARIRDQENDIWVWDFARETLTRVTSRSGARRAPAWTPDGRRLVFSSQHGGGVCLSFWQAADGTGTAERLTQQSATFSSLRRSRPTARRVLFTEGSAATADDVMMLTLDKDHRVQPLVQTPFAERNGEISPDGRWLAYQSNDSGRFRFTCGRFRT